jgi:hypothetical protein
MPEEAGVRAFRIRAGRTQRVIRLSGEIEAILEYRTTFADETVRVNGKEVLSAYRGFLGGDESVHYFFLPSRRGALQARLGVAYGLFGEA